MSKKKQGKNQKPELATKPETPEPLKVEVKFPFISDLKQAIALDTNGIPILTIQFKSLVNQYEVFRMVNLLKQPHTTLYAIIGTAQAAMDFQFDMKERKVAIVEPVKALPEAKPQEEAPPPAVAPNVLAIQDVKYNHIPEDPLSYGIAVDYIVDGGEILCVESWGKSPAEAVMSFAKHVELSDGKKEDVISAFEKLQLDEAGKVLELIRALETDEFEATV